MQIFHVEIPETLLHQALVCSGTVRQTKRHLDELEESKGPYCECSALFVVFLELDLMIAALHVYDAEEGGSFLSTSNTSSILGRAYASFTDFLLSIR